MTEVLVVGSGAREHALVWKIAQSRNVGRVYCASGNAGIAEIAQCIDIPITDPWSLANFAKERKIELTVVGQEAALAEGVVDVFHTEHLPIFGPTKRAAQIETSKILAKELMMECGIPTAAYCAFAPTETSEALRYIQSQELPVVIKEDGLAAGKGVAIVRDEKVAAEIVAGYSSAGKSFLVEEYLEGEEISTTAIAWGRKFLPLLLTQDHKQAWKGGPNTGGMGVYTPLPFVGSQTAQNLYKTITEKTLNALADRNTDFTGFLYPNIMLTPKGPMLLEYNARFGDPEAQAMLMLMKNDLVEVLNSVLNDRLEEVKLKWLNKFAVSLSLVSGGYPENYETGKVIEGVEKANKMKDVIVFHAGTKITEGKLVTAGGRVLSVVAVGDSLQEVVQRVYQAAQQIHFEGMFYREDIAESSLQGFLQYYS